MTRNLRTVAGAVFGTAVLAAIGDSPARDAIDWTNVDIWWGDERYLPTGDPERNGKGFLRPGTKITSSISFCERRSPLAMEARAKAPPTPASSRARPTAPSCPFPPSTSSNSGQGGPAAARRAAKAAKAR